MKYSQHMHWCRLVAVLLIGGVAPFLGIAHSQRGQAVPAGFTYPPSQDIIQVDTELRSISLSGVLTDPSDAGASKVLVERLRPGWGKRISAVFTDTDGHFGFAVGSGTYFLRISKPGFNTMLIKVRVSAKTRSTLRIDLKLSN